LVHKAEAFAPAGVTVLIVESSHVGSLRRRFADDPGIAVFSESDSLSALRAMLACPPAVLALDSGVVRSARGALIVSRLKEHHSVDVRVLNEEDGKLMALLANEIDLLAASRPIEDSGGTRGAKRFAIRPGVHAVVDGERAKLVNLSATGAQLLLSGRVQPKQSVRLTLVDGNIEKKFRARVAWATLELASSAANYRAGVSFVDPDAIAIEDFCLRNAVFG
jgi:hypothetical protein